MGLSGEKGPSSGAMCMRIQMRAGNLLESSSILPIWRHLSSFACGLVVDVCVLSLVHISSGMDIASDYHYPSCGSCYTHDSVQFLWEYME